MRRWWSKANRPSADPLAGTLPTPEYQFDGGEARRLMMDALDGTITAAGVIEGLIAAGASQRIITIAGTSAVLAGGLAAAGHSFTEFTAERDAVRSLLETELRELEENPDDEHAELVDIYVNRGLDRDLAEQVATQLTAHDALAAHIDEELHLREEELSIHPTAMAGATFLAYALGAFIPILAVWLSPTHLHTYVTIGAVLGSVTLISYIAARTSGINTRMMVVRTLAIAVGSLLLGYAAGIIVT